MLHLQTWGVLRKTNCWRRCLIHFSWAFWQGVTRTFKDTSYHQNKYGSRPTLISLQRLPSWMLIGAIWNPGILCLLCQLGFQLRILHFLQRLTQQEYVGLAPRWCRISSMNSINQKGKLSQGFGVKATFAGGLKTAPSATQTETLGLANKFSFCCANGCFFLGNLWGASPFWIKLIIDLPNPE